MCFYHDGYSDVRRTSMRRAAKDHRCEECGSAIARGTRHKHDAGLYEGVWYAYRTCLSCVSLRDAVIDHEIAEGCFGGETQPPIGELWAFAEEAGVVVPVIRLDHHQTLARENAIDAATARLRSLQ